VLPGGRKGRKKKEKCAKMPFRGQHGGSMGQSGKGQNGALAIIERIREMTDPKDSDAGKWHGGACPDIVS